MNTTMGLHAQEIVESLRVISCCREAFNDVALRLGLPEPDFKEIVAPERGVEISFGNRKVFVPANIDCTISWVLKELILNGTMDWEPVSRVHAITRYYLERYRHWNIQAWFNTLGECSYVLLRGKHGEHEFMFGKDCEGSDLESKIKKAVLDTIISDNQSLSSIRSILVLHGIDENGNHSAKQAGTILDIPAWPKEEAYLDVAYKSVSGLVKNASDWTELVAQGNAEFEKRERERNMTPMIPQPGPPVEQESKWPGKRLMQEWRRLVSAVNKYGKGVDARCERDKERAFAAYIIIGDERHEFDISRNCNQIDEDVKTFFKNYTVKVQSLYAPKYDAHLQPEQIRNHASIQSYADGLGAVYFPLMSPRITFHDVSSSGTEYKQFTVMLPTGAQHGFRMGANLNKEDEELFVLKTLMGLAIDFYPDLSQLLKSFGWWDAEKVYILDIKPGNTLRLSATNESERFDATPDNLNDALEFLERHGAYTRGWKVFCDACAKYGNEHPGVTRKKHPGDPRVAFIDVNGVTARHVKLNQMDVCIDNDVWNFFNPQTEKE